MTTKPYRPWSPDQPFLLPPSPSDWLPEKHFVYFLLDVLPELDLKPIEVKLQAKDPRGVLPYPPVFMVGLLLYAYCRGVFSSRRIECAIMERVDFRVLAGGLSPDHATIARFRRAHLEELKALFLQILKICEGAGLAGVGRVALDGSKFRANASKHKAMSYGCMVKKEAELQEQINKLLEAAEDTDQTEDDEYGEGAGDQDIPVELARRQTRLAKIRAAKSALEDGARQARAARLEELAEGNDSRAADEGLSSKERKAARTRAENQRSDAQQLREQKATMKDDDEDDNSSDKSDPSDHDPSDESAPLPSRKVRHTTDGAPHDKAQRNFTDPDSSIMEHKGGFEQSYNAQVVANDCQVIVATGLSNCASDTNHMQPMIERTVSNVGIPDVALADAGYWSPANAAHSEGLGIATYIATGRAAKVEAEAEAMAEAAGTDPPADLGPRERMRTKLRTPEGRDTYCARKWMVEPVFGQIKGAMGFRTFSMRGLEAARGEWGFVCGCHNLRKLFACWKRNGGLLPA